MQLNPQLHLAYCTNIHRGEDWPQTFDALQRYTLEVRERVCPTRPYAIGLRLSEQAARELSDPVALLTFRKWLDRQQCYVFTINGFPYGQFHGGRVKEEVYAPDWTTPERLAYTKRLFDLLGQLVPEGCEGSVSTLPGSFKSFITSGDQMKEIRDNLWRCLDHIASVSEKTSRHLHLGLEPEPLCYLETTAEVIEFFEQMEADRPGEERLRRHLGINYDTCHLAVEYEDPETAMARLREFGVKLSKIHLSSALKTHPTPEARQALAAFADETYLHQVIERSPDGVLTRYRDLDVALQQYPLTAQAGQTIPEWRIHFHLPLHSRPSQFDSTVDHLQGIVAMLGRHPELCSHLEMETYTWEVLPPPLKNRNVVDQLVDEYEWTLKLLRGAGLVTP